MPGFALDITVADSDDGLPWDFNMNAKREKARMVFRRQAIQSDRITHAHCVPDMATAKRQVVQGFRRNATGQEASHHAHEFR